MQSTLTKLGLNEKEARFYLFLLNEVDLSAMEIAKRLKESRTNTYMVLDKLEADKLIELDDSRPVRRYRAADPIAFRQRLISQLQEIKQNQVLLGTILPELASRFSLGQHKPGVIYLEGINGFKTLLEDNARLSEGTIDLIASDLIVKNHEAWEILQKGIAKRRAKSILTRGLFHAPAVSWAEIKSFQAKGYEVRRTGTEELPGEIVIYGNKVAFTVYQPSIIVTIMTNETMAQTFRVIFNQLWEGAEA